MQGTYLRACSAGTIRAITSLPWMLQCHSKILSFRTDPILKGLIKLATKGSHICEFIEFLNKLSSVRKNCNVQGAYLRARSAGTIRAITSLPWMLQCQRSVIIKVLDPPISNENRAHWGMNPSKWSINYETFPSHKGRKLLAS